MEKEKDLPPLKDNPILQDLVDRLKKQPDDRLDEFQDFMDKRIEDGKITKLPPAHKRAKS